MRCIPTLLQSFEISRQVRKVTLYQIELPDPIVRTDEAVRKSDACATDIPPFKCGGADPFCQNEEGSHLEQKPNYARIIHPQGVEMKIGGARKSEPPHAQIVIVDSEGALRTHPSPAIAPEAPPGGYGFRRAMVGPFASPLPSERANSSYCDRSCPIHRAASAGVRLGPPAQTEGQNADPADLPAGLPISNALDTAR